MLLHLSGEDSFTGYVLSSHLYTNGSPGIEISPQACPLTLNPVSPTFAGIIVNNCMDTNTLSLIIAALALLLALGAYLKKPPVPEAAEGGEKFSSTPMQLQAYERLVLLTERIALPNLISRLNQPGIAAVEMKIILTENIKQEYNYNSTQQLYVSAISWDAVKNLKEQNIMIINQVAATLPPEASGSDLNKRIMEVLMNQPNGQLHDLVLQALNFEAKKLMN